MIKENLVRKNNNNHVKLWFLFGLFFLCTFNLAAQTKFEKIDQLKDIFYHPPKSAKPWVYWYWMRSAVTKEGIAADLKAMSEQGIGGAYLMTIRETANPPYINPPIVPVSSEWWALIRFTMAEAEKLGLEIAMTPCDGWALAGGPWITPEMSMQKVVYASTQVVGGRQFNGKIDRPEAIEQYYKDIAVYAYQAPKAYSASTMTQVPIITSNAKDPNVQLLAKPGNKKDFRSVENCYIQYEFREAFTCRSITIKQNKSNYQAQRLQLQVSDDGKNFKNLDRLVPARNGWQDKGIDVSYSIKPVTAKFFRFVYDPAGSEPGAEDLDQAKWKPELLLCGLTLFSQPRIHQFEAKNGSVWRIAQRTTVSQLPNNLCIPKDKLINITDKLTADGELVWGVPAGNWVILRIGHTSTGYKNTAAGSATGLECDKFRADVTKIQFDNWFGEALKQTSTAGAKQILKLFHVDSWECGSQNWSKDFPIEFKKRRGYDLMPYLPLMAGIPIESAEFSEKVLSDVRETITELTHDNFFGTLKKLATEKGTTFSAEATAPTMTGDGMLHFNNVDIPMGEFWLRSPTHDKPNDMLDAISGGHIYGKNIVQSESFTELRLMWDEHPAMLKTITDRNFALGINRFVLHVTTHNPWIDRKPGMTLDGIGLFFQRDQTWWKPGKAWVDYMQRCQAMLQQGTPVVDIAVFTGEEIPRRAILPDRLVNVLPGIFGAERVAQEKTRLANEGIPIRTVSYGVPAVANMADPEKWLDPLRGYSYDSINKDALIRLATVKNGKIELPGGASYKILVIPGASLMAPNGGLMSVEVLEKLTELAKEGATIILNDQPIATYGMQSDEKAIVLANKLLSNKAFKIIKGVYTASNFDQLDLKRDVILTDRLNRHAENIAWTHRTTPDGEIYFLSNQEDAERTINVSLRDNGIPELWDAVTKEVIVAKYQKTKDARTNISLKMPINGSIFIVLKKEKTDLVLVKNNWPTVQPLMVLNNEWKVSFDVKFGGPATAQTFGNNVDWSKNKEESIKYYAGTATYQQQFNWNSQHTKNVWLNVDKIANIGEIYVNGVNCGVAWTYPYRVDVTKALKPGINELKIEITNTWANRLIGDKNLPEDKRITWTNGANFLKKTDALLPAGLLGQVSLVNIDY